MRVLPELRRSIISWLSPNIGAADPLHLEPNLIETAKRELIDRLPLGVAIFGSDRRLLLSNAHFRERFGLSGSEAEKSPLFDETLDSARLNRKIPEQRDYARWKAAKLNLFDTPKARTSEIWSLPADRVQRMTFLRNALGGLTIEIEDLTDKLQLLTAYNSLQRTQKAALDAIEDGIAIFGPDGRLRVHNRTLRRFLSLDDALLFSLPHISKLSQAYAEQVGIDEMWSIVISAINADEPDKTFRTFVHVDGRTMALSLTRLPDGGTMVRFDDVTETRQIRSSASPG